MRYVGSLILAVLMLLTSSQGARGQGKIEFTGGHPATGAFKGVIDTQGKLTPDMGWNQVGTKYIHRMWPDGGAESKATVEANPGAINTWGVVGIPDLTSGTTYNVTAEIDVFNMATKKSATLRTAPATAKAK